MESPPKMVALGLSLSLSLSLSLTRISPTDLEFCHAPAMLCGKTFSGETQYTHLLTPDRDPTTDQSTETTEIQFGEPVSFIRLIDVCVRGYLEEKNDLETAVSPRPTQACVTAHRS